MALDGNHLLQQVAKKYNLHFAQVVAETSLWASPAVHRFLMQHTGTAALYPHTRRYKPHTEKVGMIVDGVRLDNNNYANQAIKVAIGVDRSQLIGFETCHIWPNTCYDERFHTAIANLVLLPRAIASLSDYDPEVQAALQYRAYELYDWYPAGEALPVRPTTYPDFWREPFAPPPKFSSRSPVATRSNTQLSRQDHNIASIQRLVQSAGATNFVRLYGALLKHNLEDAELYPLIPASNSEKSKRSIVATTRRIVREGKAKEALEFISTLPRLDPTTQREARWLLSTLTRQSE
jgi:hypothetical protein